MCKILLIEPFYGGSHKELISFITTILGDEEYELMTMSAKKWPWRARCGSLWIAQNLPEDLSAFGTLFCSSVLNLSELIGMRPEISKLRKIVYFHENQLVYPKREVKRRDFQYGYNQITTCLAADVIAFNSEFNKNSFLQNVNKFLKLMPDHRPKDISKMIEPKCTIAYFPIDFGLIESLKKFTESSEKKMLHIVWPHRWEFDKNPDSLFDILFRLVEDDVAFRVSILGESFSEKPKIFDEGFSKLGHRIEHFGYVESKEEYFKILMRADVVLSTANHEFFGVSIAEAVKCGCLPLLPDRLVYPELYPPECLYDNEEHLFEILKSYCLHPETVPLKLCKLNFNIERFGRDNLSNFYLSLLKPNKTH